MIRKTQHQISAFQGKEVSLPPEKNSYAEVPDRSPDGEAYEEPTVPG